MAAVGTHERFDIRHHVGHDKLPAPGSDGQLSDWTAEFFSRPLDRKRPLWEMVLVEGLEGGQWALGGRLITAWSTAS